MVNGCPNRNNLNYGGTHNVNSLREYNWGVKYHSDNNDLLRDFYEPALKCAVRYDRTTGFFTASVLTFAARGIEGIVKNKGHMRLIVGCTLNQPEVEAIQKGSSLRACVEAKLLEIPLIADAPTKSDALELLAWMIANDYLEIKVSIPCSEDRQPLALNNLFHEKAGVIEDHNGDRLAFNGSINETAHGWRDNWESFHVFTDSASMGQHIDAEENSFAALWNNRAKKCLVLDLPEAIRKNLLQFQPDNDQPPKRLKGVPITEDQGTDKNQDRDEGTETLDIELKRRLLWGIIKHSPKFSNGGERIGEATSVIIPWAHQVRTYYRIWNNWPPKLLIADEVGLGKTIEAGMILRQAWLSGRAKRILILAPTAILTQWQIELREKFNLNWPIYNGHQLEWLETPVKPKGLIKKVDRLEWHKEPFVLTSSQLMRRSDRAVELLEAEKYNLIVLDEAHHARRKGAGGKKHYGPNQLLELMQKLKDRTQGLILMTATPMQIHPVEVWDLLNLLGLPKQWNSDNFQNFFDLISEKSPSHSDFSWMAKMFRAVEKEYGEADIETMRRYVDDNGKLATKKVLSALRDTAETKRRQLPSDRRKAALKIMKANTPVARLISRHTRELLRAYFKAGKLNTLIAERNVVDEFIDLSFDERSAYNAVEEYISKTYNQASGAERNAVGFVMTIYRRRLSSSFAALRATLRKRLNKIKNNKVDYKSDQDNTLDDQLADEVLDADEVTSIENEALKAEEQDKINNLLFQIEELPIDTKARELARKLKNIQSGKYETAYKQIMVFTQYSDTMDFLRDYLVKKEGFSVMCFSGRGGEVLSSDSGWRIISRDETKRQYREGKADILLCTESASEGLNFQFCGALINYDMPWNPMRVEQRIGRIDRLGQQNKIIQILNFHYTDTVETDVYLALRKRIGLFTRLVGKLQPILALLPKKIETVILSRSDQQERERSQLLSDIEESISKASEAGFDLDEITDADLEEPYRPEPIYNLETLDSILQNQHLLPPELEVERLSSNEFKFQMPGMKRAIRITTDPEYYENHSESVELWSPGSDTFPDYEGAASEEEVSSSSCDVGDLIQSGK